MIDRVTDLPAPASIVPEAGGGVPRRLRDRVRTPVVLLNLAGIVLVASAVLAAPVQPATIALPLVALVAWLVWALVAPGRMRDAALAVGGLSAAVGAGLGTTSLVAPLIAAVLVTISELAHPVRVLAGFVTAAAGTLILAAALHGMAPGDLVALLAGLAVGTLGGTTRRQRRLAELQQRALLETTLAAERETQRAQLLEARGAAARDVHDVLAHSLGGLVLQLDAIEALLEHGRVDEAATRATAARRLAGEGLSEARRAVATLRDPAAAAPAAVPDDALLDLIADHRALGAGAETEGDPSLAGIDHAHREALAAAVREALVNARRHAPDATVHLRFARRPRAMALRVANALPTDGVPSAGGGHGLLGMRERFAALADGSTARGGIEQDLFVVEATVVLP